ncbi:hypothetical protein AB1Y20_017997 [Prymnesium parvum]|uniref:Uncharacterized protein n=1 Tax=Prymnesium parvum TaxID=97485 RepID=A0AB34JLU2_PRYPA
MVLEVPPPRESCRIKVISMGEPNVGKSCLIKRYCEEKFVTKHVVTIGIDFGVKPVQVNGEAVKVNFFDMAGANHYRDIRVEFYKDAQGVLLVFDLCNKATFDALEGWLVEAEANGLRTPAMVLCGNKLDNKKRQVEEKDAKKWAAAHNCIAYFETSAKEGNNVKSMFETLFAKVVAMR